MGGRLGVGGASATGGWGKWEGDGPDKSHLKKNIVQFVIDFVQLPYIL